MPSPEDILAGLTRIANEHAFVAVLWHGIVAAALAALLGLGLLAGGFGSRAWSLIAAGAGLFYGVFGIARLGVWLDAGLLAAAVAMLACALFVPRRRPSVHFLGRVTDG